MKVFVVEDNEDSRILLESALTANGYEVDSAENGKIAFERIGADPPDLIISDILMPEMDGYALCQAVKANDRLAHIPFVFYSATYTDPQNEKLAMDLGAARFLIKPMEIDLFLQEIKAILEDKRGKSEAYEPQKDTCELQKDYSKTLARKLDKKVEQLEAEKERLAISETKYRRLIEALRENYYFYTLDAQGVITYLSPSITNMLGYTQEAFKSGFATYLTDSKINTEAACHTAQSLQGIKCPPYEIEIADKNDHIHRLEITEEPICDHRGRPVAVEGIAHDITQRINTQQEKEKLQKRLVQAQKMEAIGTLAGGIAHDFNNILSAIIGYTELSIGTLGDTNTTVTDYLDNVLDAGRRATELVQQILTFSRQTEKELKPISLRAIVNETLKLLRASLPATISIKKKIDCDALIMGDPVQIHQVIMNLCVNAGHAMREQGGLLNINLQEVNLDASSAFQLTDIRPGPYLQLTVGDTGTGMTPKIMERIFDPFFTTKDRGEGTGMGLAVVHGIVKSYGGAINTYSEEGKGTSFNVFFPIIERRAEPRDSDESLPEGGTERILYVDDEPSLVDIGELMLNHLGYKVVSQTSSINALEVFRQAPEKFDLVITDMTMPQMTGDKLAEAIIATRKDIPIILCTGFSHQLAEGHPMPDGIKGLLMKPIIRSKMAEMVRKVLDEAKP